MGLCLQLGLFCFSLGPHKDRNTTGLFDTLAGPHDGLFEGVQVRLGFVVLVRAVHLVVMVGVSVRSICSTLIQ